VAANTVAAAEAEALADAGIAQAVFALGDPDPSRRWLPDGQPRDVAFAEGRLEVTVRDENAKINPNLASDKLIAALFRRLGAGDDVAAALAASIAARVRPSPFLRPPASDGGAATDTSASSAPVPAPFDAVDEMIELSGMTPALLDAARPHLSVYATTALPTRGTLDPLVAAAVADVQSASADGRAAASGAPAKMTVTILSMARGRRGGLFVRDAVVRLDPATPNGYVALRWARGQVAPEPPRRSFMD